MIKAEMVGLCHFSAISCQVICRRNDGDLWYLPDQHAWLDFYNASLLKQQFMGRHVAPLGHCGIT